MKFQQSYIKIFKKVSYLKDMLLDSFIFMIPAIIGNASSGITAVLVNYRFAYPMDFGLEQ